MYASVDQTSLVWTELITFQINQAESDPEVYIPLLDEKWLTIKELHKRQLR